MSSWLKSSRSFDGLLRRQRQRRRGLVLLRDELASRRRPGSSPPRITITICSFRCQKTRKRSLRATVPFLGAAPVRGSGSGAANNTLRLSGTISTDSARRATAGRRRRAPRVGARRGAPRPGFFRRRRVPARVDDVDAARRRDGVTLHAIQPHRQPGARGRASLADAAAARARGRRRPRALLEGGFPRPARGGAARAAARLCLHAARVVVLGGRRRRRRGSTSASSGSPRTGAGRSWRSPRTSARPGWTRGSGGREQYRVIPNGVALERFGAGASAGAGRVVMVGRLAPPEAARCRAARVRRGPRACSGGRARHRRRRPAARRGRALAAELGLGGAVRFLGTRDDVPELLAAAECLLLASDYEGCPLVVVEAMAAGVPVVATEAARGRRAGPGRADGADRAAGRRRKRWGRCWRDPRRPATGPRELGAEGRELAEAELSHERMVDRLVGALRRARVDASNEGVAVQARSRDDVIGVTARRFAPASCRRVSPSSCSSARARVARVRRRARPTSARCASAPNCARPAATSPATSYVILNSWDAPLLPALKAANPGLKALVYKNLTFTVAYGCSNGVDSRNSPPASATATRARTIPTGSYRPAGRRLNSSGFPQAWLMDVGNPGYQAKWLSNVSPTQVGRLGRRLHGRHEHGHELAPERPHDRQVPDRRRLALRDAQHARDGRARADVAGLPRDPEHLRPLGAATTTRRPRGATGSSSPRAPRRSTTRSGARTAPAGSRATTGRSGRSSRRSPSRPGRSSSASRTRRSADVRSMTWARANFLLFDSRPRRRARVRDHRPRGAGPVRLALDGGRRLAPRAPASRSARPGGATSPAAPSLVNPTAAPVTVALERDVPRRRRLSTTLGHPRRGERRDPALAGGSTAPAPPAAPPPPTRGLAAGDADARPARCGTKARSLDGLCASKRRRLPQRPP